MNTNITEAQVKEMFEMQDNMNSKVYPDWKIRGFDWHLAAQMELMEGVEHYGYKWWKKQVPDLGQVQLEVIDAWHFWMSAVMVDPTYSELSEQDYSDLLNIEQDFVDLKPKYIGLARGYQEDLVEDFYEGYWSELLRSVGLTPYDLYIMYIQKNVLNHFRQDNGYKTGEYVKTWLGAEDNVHLLELSHQLTAEGTFSKDNLYAALEERYAEVS